MKHQFTIPTCDSTIDHAAAARAAFTAGDYPDVIAHCYCAFTANPVDLDLHMLNFQAAVRCGLHSSSQFSEAVLDTLGSDRWQIITQAARASLTQNSQDEGAAMILARVTHIVSPPAERPALIAQLQAINPQNPLPHLLTATTEKDAAATTRHLENALRLSPDDPEILCWVADLFGILEVIKDLPRALSLYDQALRLNPQLAAGLFARGMTRQDQGDFAAAHADIDAAVQLVPFDYRLYNVRAGILKAQGDDAAALADFRRALAVNPASYTALKGLTEIAVRLNQRDDRRAATEAFVSSHIVKPVEAALTPDTRVRFRLVGMEAVAVKAILKVGQPTTFTVEPINGETVFAAALLVAPDGGALLFVHRIFDQEPTLRLPVAEPISGEYTLMVIFNGLSAEEFTVRLE